MKLADAAIHDAKLMGWALLFSAIWGGVAGIGFMQFSGGSHMAWYNAFIGGAVIGPALTLVFESPLRRIVQAINGIGFGWALVLPFAIMRFVFSWPAVMLANQFMAAKSSHGPDPRPIQRLEPARVAVPSQTVPEKSGPHACPDCNGPAPLGRNDGKCSACHGSGFESNIVDATAASLAGTSQKCTRCGGSGKCPTCGGQGFLS